MKILKDGLDLNKCKCHRCECEFEFEGSDIEREVFFFDVYYKVKCPKCSAINSTTYGLERYKKAQKEGKNA